MASDALRRRVAVGVERLCNSDFSCTSDEALRALLQADASPYDTEVAAHLASYEFGKVSLPIDVSHAPRLQDLLSGVPRDLLCADRMLRSSHELDETLRMDGPARSYWDPKLAGHRPSYLEFVRDLHSRGLIVYLGSAKCHVSTFFIRKKDGRLRWLVDARTASQRFRKPPPVALCTSESFSRLELGAAANSAASDASSQAPWFSSVDVEDCFHRCRLPEWMWSYFALSPRTAAEAGLTELNGCAIDPSN